jgi:preprotein translocase subunit SecA
MSTTPAPGIVWGSYPERTEPAPLGRWWLGLRAHQLQADAAERALPRWRALAPRAFAAELTQLRARLGRDGLLPQHMAQALAATSEAVRRTLGLTPYRTQLLAATVILDNRLAEMATGEGKTLAALLAAATGGLAGIPVHVLTTNDYLVARDAERLAPVYALLGLSVGAVTQGMDDPQRRAAYACDITYVTAKQLVFDYLRDSTRTGAALQDLARRAQALGHDSPPALLRGLCMAVVDEADSLLIDEARTPLVLSRQADDPAGHAFLWQAYVTSGELREGTDFHIAPDDGQPRLTDAGRERLQALCAPLGGRWRSARLREDAIGLALQARHTHHRDQHYLVRAGRVEIIDATTGRGAPGRVWARGLHTLIEIKEGCKPSPATRTVAQISYQRFFPRYLRLGGMSGTLTDARGELREIYRLPVVRVPLRTPSARVRLHTRLYPSQPDLWTAVSERVHALQANGRPVLVGTGSVAESEALSAQLRATGIAHQVLNARHDHEEAEMVARAGQAGQVTVTTHMAGRGTDIALGPGVAAAGGLHVLCCQHNASRRLDRQLQGRCARQGDPGSTETWLALPAGDHPVLRLVAGWVGTPTRGSAPWQQGLLNAALAWQQALRAHHDRTERRRLLQADRAWEQGLSFRGRGE